MGGQKRTGNSAERTPREYQKWRRKQSIIRTKARRPDMFEKLVFTEKSDKKLLAEIEAEEAREQNDSGGIRVILGYDTGTSAVKIIALDGERVAAAKSIIGSEKEAGELLQEFLERERYSG